MNSELFKVNLKKASNLYNVRNDETKIDAFIIKLYQEFGDLIQAVSVRGLSAGVNKFGIKQLPYGFVQKAKCWVSPNVDDTKLREYYIKLYIDYNKIPFKVCNMDWVKSVDGSLEKSTITDFNYNRDLAFRLIEKKFKEYTKYFMVSVFCGVIPQSSWSNRCYIKVIIRLQVTGIDIFTHSGIKNLTEFGQSYLNEVKEEFSKIVDSENYDLSKLYIKKLEREKIVRDAENNVRASKGIKNVGDAFVNETLLAQITKKMFPDTIRQYNPKWLGKFILDIYVPSLNVAIEYQGEQHYLPIKRFGGEDKLEKQKKRDEYVRIKCKEYNVLLLEWHYSIKVNEENVYELYSNHIDLKNYKRPLDLFD